MRLPFVGGSAKQRGINVSAQRTVNCYVTIDPQGKFTTNIYARPGLRTWVNAGAAPIRGMAVFNDALYVVCGDAVRKVTATGTVTTIGIITDKSMGRVGVATGRNHLVIVTGVSGWYVDTSDVLTQITDGDFPATATHIDYISDYFVANDPSNAGRVYRSDANDPSSWGALNFATAERDPDALVGLIVNLQLLLLLGEKTTEGWVATGGDGFSFSPAGGAFTEIGCAAGRTIAELNGEVYWLGASENGLGAVLKGSITGRRISTASEEQAWAKFSTMADATAWAVHIEGEAFYVITFPSAADHESATWAYHANSGTWAEWHSYGNKRWRPEAHVVFNERHYVGDYQDGNIFELTFDAYTDAGSPIIRRRVDRAIVMADSRTRARHHRIEFDFETGLGLGETVPTEQPIMFLSWSDDGGHNFTPEIPIYLGIQGKYNWRAMKRNLGQSRDRIYAWRMSGDHRTSLASAFLDIDVGLP